MKLSLVSSLTLAAALSAPVLAHADYFSITTSPTAAVGTTPFTITFSLPATPSGVTVNSGSQSFNVTIPTVVENGVTFTNDIMTFYTTAGSGGLTDNDSAFGPYGPQLFTGTVSAPTFSIGTFNLSNELVNGVPGNTDYVLAVSANSPTPEPSSLALLGTGVLGLAGVARRRFSK